MFPIILKTPWFNVYAYGLLIALGYSIGTFIALRAAKKQNLPVEAIFDMLILQLLVGIAGSRLLFILEYTPDKLNFKDFFAFEQGGLTFYGSLISSFIFDLLYLKFRRIPFWKTMDCIGFGMLPGIAVARLGCFLNGCCYGTQTSLPFGVVFPLLPDAARHPTQLYESIMALTVFIVLFAYRRWRKNYGEVFLAATALYSFFRFFIEFFRAENPVIFMGLRLSQILAIFIIALTIFMRQKIDAGKQLRILPAAEIQNLDQTS
jgi:phosphatidylglycerol:prolipoprotein diacylglycerol transferase